MIPSIEEIITGLREGRYSQTQAEGWMFQHIQSAVFEETRILREALQGLETCGVFTVAHNLGTRSAQDAIKAARKTIEEHIASQSL